MKKIISIVVLVIVAALLVVSSCTPIGERVEPDIVTLNGGYFYYYYDEVHDVSIWVWTVPRGGGIAVLPGEDVSNPFEPMRLRD